jgi:hypothetical protein
LGATPRLRKGQILLLFSGIRSDYYGGMNYFEGYKPDVPWLEIETVLPP